MACGSGLVAEYRERRKAVMAYFLEGLAYILWDNIERGTQIGCPHIERSCTSAFYSDRKLGVSETIRTAASTIHLFTGNNIGPRGDLASRTLAVRLEADRPDPENRDFKHPDPIHWTEDHRAEILAAFYTILLGNPNLDKPRDDKDTAKTRFKMWYRIVGSAIEHAAAALNKEVSFLDLFRAADAEDEDAATVTTMLQILARRFLSREFISQEVANIINKERDIDADGDALRQFLFPEVKSDQATVTADQVGRRLKKQLDQPVAVDKQTLILRGKRKGGSKHGSLQFWIEGAEPLKGAAGKPKDKRDVLF